MKPSLYSLIFMASLLGASAQTMPGTPGAASGNGAGTTLPVGQVYKDFTFPFYSNGHLQTLFSGLQAKSVTVNRAVVTDVKIELFNNDKVETTITSPAADLFMSQRVLRTKNTATVDREDSITTGQQADFDLLNKKYIFRQNVRMVLKHFDVGKSSTPPATATASVGAPTQTDTPASGTPSTDNNLLQTPGASSFLLPTPTLSTNATPLHTP